MNFIMLNPLIYVDLMRNQLLNPLYIYNLWSVKSEHVTYFKDVPEASDSNGKAKAHQAGYEG